jgi:hypothetical protein
VYYVRSRKFLIGDFDLEDQPEKSPVIVPERRVNPFLRTKHALLELLAHLLVVAGMLSGIWLLEKFLHLLWGPTELLFFGSIKVKYIFDAADLAILVGFLIYGVYSVIAAYVRKP